MEVLIKKYSNRKLYLVQAHRYTDHNEILNIIKSGKIIKVIDNITQCDITKETLSRAIAKNMLDNKLSSEYMHNLIRNQGVKHV